jgi:hypothetical protein
VASGGYDNSKNAPIARASEKGTTARQAAIRQDNLKPLNKRLNHACYTRRQKTTSVVITGTEVHAKKKPEGSSLRASLG